MKLEFLLFWILIINSNFSIYYNFFESLPSESTLDNYTYTPLYIYDTKTTSSGISYYFKGSILSGNNYAVIKYSGRYPSGIIKTRGSFINFLKK